MAILNAQTVGVASVEWQTSTVTATSSTSTESTSISFTVTGNPKQWVVACTNISGSYYTLTTTTSQYRRTSGYYDGSSGTGAILQGGTSTKLGRSTGAGTGSYSNGTFTVTSSESFPMRRSSYYMTWTLFYTV